mmetsp:Transcript_51921/g.93363  ORF Transcript_51921/g.93363 Transcript_51921/m.93363 type:complete len:331 (+) Transcript_51921:52-1044(+)
MKLLLTLMSTFAVACKASTLKAGATNDYVDYIAGRAEMLEISNELADARNELQLQTNVLTNVVAQVNDLEADYRSDPLRNRLPHQQNDKLHWSAPTLDSRSSVHTQDKVTKGSSLRKAKKRKAANLVESKQEPEEEDDSEEDEDGEDAIGFSPMHPHFVRFNFLRAFAQLVFGVVYFFLIVQHYPRATPNGQIPAEAVQLQKLHPFAAAFQASPKILLCSFCCPGPRTAQTFEITGVMNYWISLVCASCFPCCTLFVASTVTDLHVRLGGQQMGALPGCLSACFCSWCMIAQDAESLDLMMGVRTGLLAMETPQDRMMQAVAGSALRHMV